MQFRSLKAFGVLVLLLMSYAKTGASDLPVIEFTYLPPCGSFEDLEGRILNVVPGDYRVAVYIRVGYGWWNKPTWAQPLTPIQDDGNLKISPRDDNWYCAEVVLEESFGYGT